MTDYKKFFVVIAYDITDDKRRTRLAQTLLNYGNRVQYSVFEAYLFKWEIDEMRLQISRIIKHSEDSVRIYVLTKKSRKDIITIGVQREYQDPDVWVI